MDTHEPLVMTRRRYRSLVGVAEDAARTASGTGSSTRRAPARPVPLPRARRRASLRGVPDQTTS